MIVKAKKESKNVSQDYINEIDEEKIKCNSFYL
jgi:hypothetical protein